MRNLNIFINCIQFEKCFLKANKKILKRKKNVRKKMKEN